VAVTVAVLLLLLLCPLLLSASLRSCAVMRGGSWDSFWMSHWYLLYLEEEEEGE
jgi:hypothetical protein